jgi:hypothetical protein
MVLGAVLACLLVFEPAGGREAEVPEGVVAPELSPGTGEEEAAAALPVAEPAAVVEPGVEPISPPEFRVAAIGRLHNWLGLVAAGSWERRVVGAGAEGPEAELTGGVASGGVMARLAGYAERKPAASRVIRMTLPELMLTLELGGGVVRQDAGARERGVTAGAGVVGGARGVANIGAAFASPGRVGVYAKIWVGQRFLARGNDAIEGAYFIGSAGPGFGLRVAAQRRWTLLVGGALDGQLGVARVNASRLVAQLAPAVELATYVQPRQRVYFGIVGRGELTALGLRYGGRRLHGRMTAELIWKLRSGIRPRFAGLLLVYEGGRVEAAAGHPQFAAGGERRGGHHVLLAGGVTF